MRFINEDIVTGDISNSNSLNRYSYVEGNPVTMVDPFGLCGRSCISSNQFERRSKVASLSRTEYMWDLLVQTCKYEFYQNASPETLQTIGDVCDVGATFFDYLGQVLDNTSKISGQVAKVVPYLQEALQQGEHRWCWQALQAERYIPVVWL